MKEVIRQLTARKSIQAYTDRDTCKTEKATILQAAAANMAATFPVK